MSVNNDAVKRYTNDADISTMGVQYPLLTTITLNKVIELILSILTYLIVNKFWRVKPQPMGSPSRAYHSQAMSRRCGPRPTRWRSRAWSGWIVGSKQCGLQHVWCICSAYMYIYMLVSQVRGTPSDHPLVTKICIMSGYVHAHTRTLLV